jgi:uncharacterized protein DUF6311
VETQAARDEEAAPQEVRAPVAPGPRLRAALRGHAPALVAAGAGVAWFLHHGGAALLDPTNVGWAMTGDWASAYLGWAFHRLAPWTLPLGANPEYPFPIGSALAASDSIPVVGALLRPFSAALPQDFQYLGPWIGLSFALQGFAGAKLVRLVTESRAAQALGGALFALAPPLLHRVVGPNTGHASLTAHWLLLALLWLALAPVDAARLRGRLAAAAALVLLATGVHPYHVLAGLALATALVVRLWAVERLLRWPTAALAAAGLAAAAALGLLAFGYLGGGLGTPTWGFGNYSADALALVNPLGWSRAFGALPTLPGQYEGFAYLGGGVLALCAIAVGSALLSRSSSGGLRWRAALPVAIAALLLAVVSLSEIVTVAGRRVLVIGAYSWLPAFGTTFRSSGRLVWSLHYLVLLAAIAAVASAWRSRPRVLVGSLGVALAMQAADVRPPVPLSLGASAPSIPSEVWETARGTYRHVALVPPYVVANGGAVGAAPDACGRPWPWDAYVPAAKAAYRLNATVNSAYVARIDPAKVIAACREQRSALLDGHLDPATIYVVHPTYGPILRAAGAGCGHLDGLLLCVDGARASPFREALRRTMPGAAPPR